MSGNLGIFAWYPSLAPVCCLGGHFVKSQCSLTFAVSDTRSLLLHQVMVFFSSCNSVKYHAELLNYVDIPVKDIHGKQKQQKRTATFFEFCQAETGVLLCTDVAARGLDIPGACPLRHTLYPSPSQLSAYVQSPRHSVSRVGLLSSGSASLNALRTLQQQARAGQIWQAQGMGLRSSWHTTDGAAAVTVRRCMGGAAVDWIIQYDPPDDPKEYIHRVGRTARGKGGKGRALLLLLPEELGFLTYLQATSAPLPIPSSVDLMHLPPCLFRVSAFPVSPSGLAAYSVVSGSSTALCLLALCSLVHSLAVAMQLRSIMRRERARTQGATTCGNVAV